MSVSGRSEDSISLSVFDVKVFLLPVIYQFWCRQDPRREHVAPIGDDIIIDNYQSPILIGWIWTKVGVVIAPD